MATESAKPKTTITSDERGLSTWLVWALMLTVGLLGWAMSSSQLQTQEGSLSRTVNAATRFQSTASSVNAEAVLAAFGNAGSLDRLGQMRNTLQSDLTLLQRGGFMNPEDKFAVLALGGRSDIPLAAVTTKMATFDAATSPMLGAYDTLSRAATAETGLPTVINQLRTTASSIQSTPVFSRPPWSTALTPVLTDLTRRELDSMGAVFTPSDGGRGLAKQWSDIFVLRAKDAQSLASLAPKDSTLSPSERQLINDLSTHASQLSSYTQVLLSTMETRLQVRESLPVIREASVGLQESSDQLVKSINALSQKSGALQYMVWGFMGLAFVGLLGVLRSLWVMGYQRWRAQQDGHKGAVLSSALEKMTRELRKIIALESTHDKLFQPPESPVFALSSMINQVLTLKSEASSLMEEQGRVLQTSSFELDGLAGMALQKNAESHGLVASLAQNGTIQAEVLADLSHKVEQAVEMCQHSIETSFRGGAIVQETSWKMESLRENTQSTAKRIKRLGEGTQTITASSDMIKDMTRKVKVLALNLAVEAAGHGEQGKAFAALARELERLAQSAEESVKDIDNQITIIQTDAKETVSSMENGITDVVQVARLSSESINTFKEQDRGLEKLKFDLEISLKRLEQVAVEIHRESVFAKNASDGLADEQEQLRGIRQRMEALRDTAQAFRKWLNGIGRDI